MARTRGQLAGVLLALVVSTTAGCDGTSSSSSSYPPPTTQASTPLTQDYQCRTIEVPTELAGVVSACQDTTGALKVTNTTTVTVLARSPENYPLRRLASSGSDLKTAILETDAGPSVGAEVFVPPGATVVAGAGTVTVERSLMLSARTTAMQAVAGYVASRYTPRHLQLQQQFQECGQAAADNFSAAYRASGGTVDVEPYIEQSVQTVSACKSLYTLLKEADGEQAEARTFQTEVRAALSELRSAARVNWSVLFEDFAQLVSRRV